MKIARFYTMQYLQLTYVHTQVRYIQAGYKKGRKLQFRTYNRQIKLNYTTFTQ